MGESLGGGRSAFMGGSSGTSRSIAQSSASAPPSGPSQQQQWSRFRPSQGSRGPHHQCQEGDPSSSIGPRASGVGISLMDLLHGVTHSPSFSLEPTRFTTSAHPQQPQYELTPGQDRNPKAPEQDEMVRRMRSLEQSLKNMQGLSGQKSVSYTDLCMFPHVHLPVGFKTPKFEKYDGHGDLIAHLKKYCNQLRGADGKEEFLMAYFREILVGIASEWYMDQDISCWHIWDDLARDFVKQFQYNIDIALDRNSLTNLKKKSSESFREYAVKWSEQASRIKPPMDEVEMVTVFLQAQEADYFQNMMSAMGKSFAEAIKIGEMVENGLKMGRILSQSAIRATSQAIQGGSGGIAKGKKREETFMAALGTRRNYTPRSLFSERTPQHYYPHQDLAYTPQPYSVMNTQPYVRPKQQANRNQAPPPRNQPPYRNHYNPQLPQNNLRPQEPPRRQTFTPIVPQTRQNPASPAYRAGVRCAYHSGVEGHDTNDCWTLKRAVENLIEQGKIVLRDEEVPNVTNNPLPAHNNGPLIGMICEDKEFDHALKAIIVIVDAERKPKAAPKQEKGEKKTNTVKAELEKKAETKTETMVPSKNEVLYIPRGRSEKPQRFEMKRGIPMYVSKGDYVQQTLVTYKGKEIKGELPENTSAGKYSNIQEVNNAARKRFPPKKPVSAEEAEAFFQKMNMPDYEVVVQLRKYPEQVSTLSLLMRSAEHQKILLKTLNETYVPAETSVEQLERMTERFFLVNQVSFSKNDLPPEGAAHNKSLHLTVKCEDYYVKRVMLDGVRVLTFVRSPRCKEWKLGP
ncbi:uncharacterized protein [Nicotiana sylvestris]|uniref:uncharacterized protein n=1 Tax=Nicotiana sylvestris TaxID=4096 RepID=UPI00388CAE10